VSFSKYVIWLATRSALPAHGVDVTDFTHYSSRGPLPDCPPGLVDWNLDSDRGYGYHCWDWNRHQDADPGKLHDKQHQDPNSHWFTDPCTWPPQAASWCLPAYKDKEPLLLHWVDREDPGCDVDPDCVEPTT